MHFSNEHIFGYFREISVFVFKESLMDSISISIISKVKIYSAEGMYW